MSNFEEILRSSLAGTTEGYRVANGDLNEVVAAVSLALQKVTDLPIKLELRRVSEEIGGTTYFLNLTWGNNSDTIAAFRVPSKGYPIVMGNPMSALPGQLVPIKVLDDKAGLEGYFAELSTNLDSALLQRIAFLLRTREKPVDQR